MKNKVFLPSLVFILITVAPALPAQNTGYLGMTYDAGIGTIFSFNPITDTESTLYTFGANDSDGGAPYGNLVYNPSNGLFYGMNSIFGSHNGGTIFTFDPSSNAEHVVWNFGTDSDGYQPHGDLVYDANNGLFYGMTYYGGRYNNAGTIISFDPSTNIEHVVWNFGVDSDGANPTGSLVYDPANGLFYGMTEFGGDSVSSIPGFTHGGTIISFNPTTNTEQVILRFFAAFPTGNLVYNASNGLFYGMTPGIGSGGNIFSFNPVTGTDSTLVMLPAKSNPYGSLVYDSNKGLFYAMTYAGSGNDATDFGTILSFNPDTNTIHALYGWDLLNLQFGLEAHPYGNLVYNSDDSLFYGLTGEANQNMGGSGSTGTIISFNPSNGSIRKLWTFGENASDGRAPYGNLVPYSIPTGITTINNTAFHISVYPNPNKGSLTIKGLIAGQVIEVYNTLGQETNTLVATGATKLVDISAQATGLYLIQIRNMDGSVAVQQKVIRIN